MMVKSKRVERKREKSEKEEEDKRLKVREECRNKS